MLIVVPYFLIMKWVIRLVMINVVLKGLESKVNELVSKLKGTAKTDT